MPDLGFRMSAGSREGANTAAQHLGNIFKNGRWKIGSLIITATDESED
jgi:hypothetical protein